MAKRFSTPFETKEVRSFVDDFAQIICLTYFDLSVVSQSVSRLLTFLENVSEAWSTKYGQDGQVGWLEQLR